MCWQRRIKLIGSFGLKGGRGVGKREGDVGDKGDEGGGRKRKKGWERNRAKADGKRLSDKKGESL